MTQAYRLCAVPGCGARLAAGYASYAMRVCKTHRHAAGHCCCAGCAPKAVAVPVLSRVADRSGIRVALVRTVVLGSTLDGQIAVSLPKEPWA
jgi:hypothetical protein